MNQTSRRHLAALFATLAALVAMLPTRARAEAAGGFQAPSLKAPERGSVAGELARFAFGPGDVARGTFSLPLTMELPSERGSALAPLAPSYSPENGLSEWGAGFQNTLSLTRWRPAGDVDYATDGLTGPWGTMVVGSDEAFYSLGLSSSVRVRAEGDTLVARLPDGSVWRFGESASARIATKSGIYSWHLTSIETKEGWKQTLTYETSPTGKRPYLVSYLYGGTNPATPAYRVTIQYKPLTTAFEDFRSGERVVLDRRVAGVQVDARHLTTGAFVRRWSYAFEHQEDNPSPAFRLFTSQRTYASGQTEPKTVYGYRPLREVLAASKAREVPKLSGLASAYGTGVAWNAGLVDLDHDGRLDLETPYDKITWLQTDDGFVERPAAAPSEATDWTCRGEDGFNAQARTLARLLGPGGDVHVFVASRGWDATLAYICDRDSHLLALLTLPGEWAVGKTTKLVDVNRDGKPDLVSASSSGIYVRLNTSTSSQFSFGEPVASPLSLPDVVDELYVADFNGDSIPDAMLRSLDALRVVVGTGRGSFSDSWRSMALWSDDGGTPRQETDLATATLFLADLNRDGLTDIARLGSAGGVGATRLFLSDGNDFWLTTVPGLAPYGNSFSSSPLPLDLAGTGNTELTFADGTGAVMSLALDAPEAGLLTSVEDGKGARLEFSYRRAAPALGLRNRPVVLASATSIAIGYDELTYEYEYTGAKHHTAGGFLLGFDLVVRRAPTETESVAFLNEDRYSGVVLSSATRDLLMPSLERVTFRQYEDATSFGVPWKRLRKEGAGYSSTDPQAPRVILEETEILAYEDELCPAVTDLTSLHGTLRRATRHEHPAGLADHLACLPGAMSIAGTHTDATLNFVEGKIVSYDDRGRVTSEGRSGGGGTITDRTVTYGPQGLVKDVISPASGTTSFEWRGGETLIASVTDPNGVVSRADSHDPVTGKLLALTLDRGGLQYTQSFRYDGQERLERGWNNLGAASEKVPNALYTYKHANLATGLPGLVTTKTLHRVTAGTGAYQSEADVATAAGDALAHFDLRTEGWATTNVNRWERSTRRTESFERAPLKVASLDAITLATLYEKAAATATSTSSPLDVVLENVTTVQAGVQRVVDNALEMGASLELVSTENGAQVSRSTLDAQRRMLQYTDPEAKIWGYRYDAAGRLRSVVLPSGESHAVTFDALGRVSSVERSGVALLRNTYEPTTGRLSRKDYSAPGASSPVLRSISFAYDAAGRVSRETHSAGGTSQTVDHFFDGATPIGSGVVQRGLETGVRGPGFSKTRRFRADGSLAAETLAVDGAFSVATSYDHDEDGAVRARTVLVTDDAGKRISSTVLGTARDVLGRATGQTLDGKAFSAFGYDGEGLLQTATFDKSVSESSAAFTLRRDAVTRALRGLDVRAGAWTATESHTITARGFVGGETFTSKAATVARTYGYTDAGYLAASADAASTLAYRYDEGGRMAGRTTTPAGQAQQVSNHQRSGSELMVGSVRYRFDDLGRVIAKGDAALSYGPMGHVAEVRSGANVTRYVYDETGHRLAAFDNAVVRAVFPSDGSSINAAEGLVEPVEAEGRLLGLLHHGHEGQGLKAFVEATLADARGTRFADGGGTLLAPSPYGQRSTRPARAQSVDYARKGWDERMGAVRMGVRDYDPDLGEFLQPDPLFFEKPEQCLKSPIECNLYGYARGNPLAYVDPSGEIADAVAAGGALVAGAALVGYYYLSQPATQRDMSVALGAAYDRINEVRYAAHEAFEQLSRDAKAYVTAKADEVAQRFGKDNKYVFATYTVALNGSIYSGRTSAWVKDGESFGKAAQRAVDERWSDDHHKRKYAPPGTQARLDAYLGGTLSAKTTAREMVELGMNFIAIQGREQQLMDFHGGATREGGTSGNTRREVAAANPLLNELFHFAADTLITPKFGPVK